LYGLSSENGKIDILSFSRNVWATASKHGNAARFCAAICLSLFLVFCSFSIVQAQTAVNPRVTLYGDSEIYDMVPYARSIKETDDVLTAKEARALFNGSRISENFSTNIVRLADTTHWIAFDVVNQSSYSDWVLSFGDQLHGRLGVPDEISVLNTTTGDMLVDMRRDSNNEYMEAGTLMGNAVPIRIKRGETASILMRVTPNAYLPLIFPISLKSASAHTAHHYNNFWDARSIEIVLILMLGFYVAFMLAQRNFSLMLFSAFIAFQYLAYHAEGLAFYGGGSYAGFLTIILINSSAILGLLITKTFLRLDHEFTAQNRFLLFIGVLCFSAMLTGIFVFPAGNIAGIVLSFLPLILAPLVMVLIALGRMQQHNYGVMAFVGGCLIGLMGNVTTLAAILGVVPATEFKMFALWGGVLLQNAFFILAVVVRQILDERDMHFAAIEEEEDQGTVKKLSRSKVEAENNRLLKLIQHEREVMNDLREREIEQNTETRRARESAEEANRAKSAFLAVISHEIRTPMTGVLGMARLLIQEQLTKKQKDYAQTIKDSGEAMVSLLNDILDFEKIESNNLDLENVDFDLVRLLNGVVTLMSGHATAKNIKLEHEIDPAVPNIVVGDSVRLRQILLNLVGNAIKFTEKGGVTLIVKLQQDAAHKGTNKQKITFAIKDTGIGISPEAQKNLFNPFSQADSSITRKFGGTGLGLAISQRLVEAMGSKIEITSSEGEGSTFFFSISMMQGDEKRAEDGESGASQHENQKPEKELSILIVEDNEVNQKLLTELLRRMGHSTKVAGSGEDGLTLLEENNFDLILMDVHLPGISGMGATKAIRALADREKAATPVIALTGNIASEDVRACYAANMNAYIAKPVDPDILTKTINKVSQGELENPIELNDVAKKADDKHVMPAAQEQKPDTAETPSATRSDESLKIQEGEETQGRSLLDPPPVAERAPEESESDLLAPPPPPPSEEPAVQSLDEQGEDKDTIDNHAPKEEAQKTENESLKALAADLENFNFDVDDFDLEEDSFAAAIEIGENHEKDMVNGFETADVLDRTILDNLRRSIGHDRLEDMVSEMFMKLDELSQSLRKAADTQDRQAFLDRAHELKGMSANFGLMQIKVLFQQAEINLKNDEDVDLYEILNNLTIAEDAAKSALQRWVGASAELSEN
jgi:signal transduction histidine kinase/DNA-binding NarL/FixJ family response regulator/HPt (histidine-containing phosphotransfer) domain-containing protein